MLRLHLQSEIRFLHILPLLSEQNDIENPDQDENNQQYGVGDQKRKVAAHYRIFIRTFGSSTGRLCKKSNILLKRVPKTRGS